MLPCQQLTQPHTPLNNRYSEVAFRRTLVRACKKAAKGVFNAILSKVACASSAQHRRETAVALLDAANASKSSLRLKRISLLVIFAIYSSLIENGSNGVLSKHENKDLAERYATSLVSLRGTADRTVNPFEAEADQGLVPGSADVVEWAVERHWYLAVHDRFEGADPAEIAEVNGGIMMDVKGSPEPKSVGENHEDEAMFEKESLQLANILNLLPREDSTVDLASEARIRGLSLALRHCRGGPHAHFPSPWVRAVVALACDCKTSSSMVPTTSLASALTRMGPPACVFGCALAALDAMLSYELPLPSREAAAAVLLELYFAAPVLVRDSITSPVVVGGSSASAASALFDARALSSSLRSISAGIEGDVLVAAMPLETKQLSLSGAHCFLRADRLEAMVLRGTVTTAARCISGLWPRHLENAAPSPLRMLYDATDALALGRSTYSGSLVLEEMCKAHPVIGIASLPTLLSMAQLGGGRWFGDGDTEVGSLGIADSTLDPVHATFSRGCNEPGPRLGRALAIAATLGGLCPLAFYTESFLPLMDEFLKVLVDSSGGGNGGEGGDNDNEDERGELLFGVRKLAAAFAKERPSLWRGYARAGDWRTDLCEALAV